MNEVEMARFNDELREMFPLLRERLRKEHGDQLDEWLAHGKSKAVIVSQVEDPCDAPFIADDQINEAACELFYLDIEGYDGFHPGKPLTLADCEALRNQVRQIAKERVVNSGLKQLIDEIVSGYYGDRPSDESDAVFFVWAAMVEDGLSQLCADLWMLERSPERHGYIFLLEDGVSLNAAWGLCLDHLRPEVSAVLNADYLEIEEQS